MTALQDHWMRDEEVSHGRECICPEVNRNKNIGEVRANVLKFGGLGGSKGSRCRQRAAQHM